MYMYGNGLCSFWDGVGDFPIWKKNEMVCDKIINVLDSRLWSNFHNA
jgi:hypothetical protein